MTRRTFYTTAYGRTIAIELDDIEIELPFLPFPWISEIPDEPIDRIYRASVDKEGKYVFSIDEQTPSIRVTPAQLGDDLEGDLHHWLATYTRGFIFVHAGCVSWRDRAIVIPGRSHAGKTTLTRALVEAGATYYSDDYAVVDHDGRIWPFPRRLHVRPITPAQPHKLDPVASNWPIGQTPIRAILVAQLRYDRDRQWDIEPLTHGLGVIGLLDNTVAARERPEDSLSMMARVMIDATAIKGTRGEADESAHTLLDLANTLLDDRLRSSQPYDP